MKLLTKILCMWISLLMFTAFIFLRKQYYWNAVKINQGRGKVTGTIRHVTANRSFVKNVTRTAPFYESVIDGSKLYLNCDICAFITSSGFLLNSGLGGEIDKYDCTIRTNDSPTTYYEKDVGIKTTVRILGFPGQELYDARMNKSEIHDIERNGTVLLGWGPPRLIGKDKDFTNHLIKWKERYEGLKVYQFVNITWGYQAYDKLLNDNARKDKSWSGYLRRLFGQRTVKTNPEKVWLSTGFFGMLFARQYCGKIYVYGMTNEKYCKEISNKGIFTRDKPYHYYDNLGLNNVGECKYSRWQKLANEGHKFDIEKQLIWQWAREEGNIFFKYP